MTLTIAHRGEPLGHIENTVSSLRAAVAAGADMVEIDVRLTSDGVPVVLHDADLGRIWRNPARVADLTADEVARWRVPGGLPGAPDEPSPADADGIPTLAELARAARSAGTQLMVDLPEPAAIPAAHRVLTELGMLEQCLFAGRSPSMRTLMPAARLALSWDELDPPDHQTLDFFRPEYFNPHFQLLTAAVADRMHERGLAVSVWTVDHPRDMTAVIIQGADAVITNRIAELVQLVSAG